MSFRKRHVGISSNANSDSRHVVQSQAKQAPPGTRPSPLDGRLVTSTGTKAIDGLLAGHGGLALGCSLLIEEGGTTDYAGALLKFYAAEGLLQGQHVHVLGLPDQWGRELPGVVDAENEDQPGKEADKLKIAWRYEKLDQFGSSASPRDLQADLKTARDPSVSHVHSPTTFNHSFDLTKRLVHPALAVLNFIPVAGHSASSPFDSILAKLITILSSSAPETVHRLLIPSLLSPMLYGPQASDPQHLLPFLHSLRSLLTIHRLTAIITLPLSLYPRSAGLTRWIEILADGVLELAPFPHTSVAVSAHSSAEGSTEEPPQGLLRLHKLPILNETGSGNRSYDDYWTFSLSRRKLTIKPFNLPPMEGDEEAQREAGQGSTAGEKIDKPKPARKADMEF